MLNLIGSLMIRPSQRGVVIPPMMPIAVSTTPSITNPYSYEVSTKGSIALVMPRMITIKPTKIPCPTNNAIRAKNPDLFDTVLLDMNLSEDI